jgi:S-formylglutathione hydrolase FrmB
MTMTCPSTTSVEEISGPVVETPDPPGGFRRRALMLVAAVLATLVIPTAVPSSPAGAVQPQWRSHAGITVLGADQANERLTHVRISTPAIDNNALATQTYHDVSILLPDDYDPQVSYPVLYLLHGQGGSNDNWLELGQAEQITAGRPLIVVMPQAGRAGWGVNWVYQSQGAQNWEQFHLDQLIPWVDENLNTIDHKYGRAIAGFSMGGVIAVRHAAMRPSLFAFVGGFSGGYNFEDLRMRATITGSLALPGNGFFIDGPMGAPWHSAWRTNNPWRRAASFRDMHTVLYAGSNWGGGFDGILERESHSMSFQFWNRIRNAGANRTWFLEYNDRTCGHHWGCAREALSREIGPMMDVLWGP